MYGIMHVWEDACVGGCVCGRMHVWEYACVG